MSRRWEYFKEGSKPGGVRIIERVEGVDRTQAGTEYQVVCLRCGEHMRMSHAKIFDRVVRQTSKCVVCKNLSDEDLANREAKQRPAAVVVRGWDLRSGFSIPGGVNADRSARERRYASYGQQGEQ